ATQLAQGIDKFRQQIQSQTVPQSAIDAEFAKLKAQDAVYNNLIATISDLNARKAANAQAMSKSLDAMGKDLQTINADTAAIDNFIHAYNESVASVDHSTVIYMRDMEQRQLDRLQKYLYFMAKAYEYRLLKPYTGNLRLDELVGRLKDMLAKNGN